MSSIFKMADFEEAFELCKVPNGVELLGVERHSEDDFVILTFRNREILVYNVADRKIVKSWSVEAKQNISCAAGQDFSTRKYYMVRNEQQLLTWDDSVSDLREASIVQLPKAARKIHICSSRVVYHEPMIVFKDNELLPLSCVGKQALKKSHEAKQRLLWLGAHKSPEGKLWLSKILTSQNCSKVTLIMQPFEQSLAESQYLYTINNPTTDGKLFCWALLNDEEAPHYISLWSDGCLYKTTVPLVIVPESNQSRKAVLQCELVARLPECSLPHFRVSCCLLSHIGSTFVCVATTSTSTSESKQMEDTLSLWDVKFGALHARKSLNDIMKSSDETAGHVGFGHLQCTSSFLIVAKNSCVIACSYRAEKSTLKNSLGMLFKRESSNIKPMFLGTPELIRPHQSVQDWTASILKEDESEDELLERLLDPKKTATGKKLAEELETYYKVKSDREGNTDGETKELSNRQQRKNASKPPVVSQYFLTCVFERCLAEKDMWSHDFGSFLLKTNILPQRYLQQFVGLVLENNDTKLLQECFQELNGIPETSIVDCLMYILRADESKFVRCEVDEWTQTHPPCGFSQTRYLCLILAYPINDVFMQENLKRLYFEETLLFIRFLLHMIKNWTQSFEDLLKLRDFKHKLSYAQILDWAGLTLNAHFTQLIMLAEAQTLLVNLHEAVSNQINTYEHLEQLDGYLSHFKNHEPLPRKDCVRAYAIESMQI